MDLLSVNSDMFLDAIIGIKYNKKGTFVLLISRRIEKICRGLNCNIGDIVEIVPQDLER